MQKNIHLELISVKQIAVGCQPEERATTQPVEIVISFSYSFETDKFLCYKALNDQIDIIAQEEFVLLEDLCCKIAEHTIKYFATFQIANFSICAEKKQLPPELNFNAKICFKI